MKQRNPIQTLCLLVTLAFVTGPAATLAADANEKAADAASAKEPPKKADAPAEGGHTCDEIGRHASILIVEGHMASVEDMTPEQRENYLAQLDFEELQERYVGICHRMNLDREAQQCAMAATSYKEIEECGRKMEARQGKSPSDPNGGASSVATSEVSAPPDK